MVRLILTRGKNECEGPFSPALPRLPQCARPAAAMPAPRHRTFRWKALVCSRLKRCREALEAANKAIELDPTCSGTKAKPP